MKRSVNFSQTRKPRNAVNDIATFLQDIGVTPEMLCAENSTPIPFPIITTSKPAEVLALCGVPVVGSIVPIPDPVYGHTFRLPNGVNKMPWHDPTVID